MPLAGTIDVEAEIARLQKELEYQQGFLSSVNKKLSNERFVQNAPEQVVAIALAGSAPTAHSAILARAYGIPPVRYRHHVRVMDALMRFADGALPADVSQDVGFEDLSRFYKVFRRITCAPPGSYRPRRSRIAKT